MTSVSLKAIAMICETFLFIYLGITVAVYVGPGYRVDWSITMIIFAVLLCAIARFCQIMVLGTCVNTRRTKKIPWKMLWVMVFAGLRGAIAFALSLNVTTPHRDLIVSTTMTIVLATTMGNGVLTLPFLTKMGMVRGPNAKDEPPTVWRTAGRKPLGLRWVEYDRKTLQRVFGGAYFPKHAAPVPQPEDIQLTSVPKVEEKGAEEEQQPISSARPSKPAESTYSVGEQVFAPWSDGNYYAATIEAALDESDSDATYRVKFGELNEDGVVYQSQLRKEKPN